MSKKPKKTKISKLNRISKAKKQNAARRSGSSQKGQRARAAFSLKSAIKGIITNVRRTHGFISEIDAPENEYFVSGRDLLGGVPGDIVLFVKTASPRDESSKPEAMVVKILKSSDNVLVGGIVDDEDGNLVLVPDTFGSRRPLQIGSWGGFKLKNHDKVSFRIKSRGVKHHEHIAEITSVFGSSRSARVCVTAYLEEKGITPEFSPDSLEQAQLCGEVIDTDEIPNRLDLREMPIFTIDGSDTKDIDDAICMFTLPTFRITFVKTPQQMPPHLHAAQASTLPTALFPCFRTSFLAEFARFFPM
jgi:exoribonuclease R